MFCCCCFFHCTVIIWQRKCRAISSCCIFLTKHTRRDESTTRTKRTYKSVSWLKSIISRLIKQETSQSCVSRLKVSVLELRPESLRFLSSCLFFQTSSVFYRFTGAFIMMIRAALLAVILRQCCWDRDKRDTFKQEARSCWNCLSESERRVRPADVMENGSGCSQITEKSLSFGFIAMC